MRASVDPSSTLLNISVEAVVVGSGFGVPGTFDQLGSAGSDVELRSNTLCAFKI